MGGKTSSLKSYQETSGKPLIQYYAYDPDGKKVRVNPKNPSKHESDHPLYTHPTFYLNLGDIISNPTQPAQLSTSKTPAASARMDGITKVYRKKGYVKSLDIPGYIGGLKNEETLVVVYYPDEGENYTLTYRLKVLR